MAVPRLAPFDGSGVALPQPLAAPDAAVLRRLFAQRALPAPAFVQAVSRLDTSVRLNDEMLGHVLAERYLTARGAQRASAAELDRWLNRYASLPDAAAIAALLHPPGRSRGLAPRSPVVSVETPPSEPVDPAGGLAGRDARLDAALRARLHAGAFDAAERLMAGARGLQPVYEAALHAERAQALFTHNRDAEALAAAEHASMLGNRQVGLAEYVAGLAAWRLGQPGAALNHFAAAVAAPIADPALHAAAAYWAARASLASGDQTRWQGWLTYAAAQTGTFYGMVAGRALGRTGDIAFADAVLGEADIAAVSAQPGGMRAFALLQIGQTARAEAELRQLTLSDASRPNLLRAVMLVASRAGMLDLAADLATRAQPGDGRLQPPHVAVPKLSPRNGFLMDPALVYALARIESNFDPHAVSAEGAQGMMQLMPHTAGSMAHGVARLRDPAVNLDLGQRYVAYLAADRAVAGDLIRLLACYNSGPAAYGRWGGAIRDFRDPLLFIEAIPTDETRRFVQRALAFTWIYAERLGLPTPSLDALANGQYPRFSHAAGGLQQVVLH